MYQMFYIINLPHSQPSLPLKRRILVVVKVQIMAFQWFIPKVHGLISDGCIVYTEDEL